MSPLLTEATYVGAILVASTCMLSLVVWLWKDVESQAAKLFVAWAALYPLLGVLIIGHVLSPTITLARQFHNLVVAFGSLAPVIVFLFTIAYTGHVRWLSRRFLGLFAAWYVALAVLVVSNPVHGLAYSEFVTETDPFTYVVGTPTPLFTIVSLPLWLITVVPLALLGARALSDSGITRAQTLSLFAGFCVPIIVMSLWFGGVLPGPPNGAFVIASPITGLIVAWAVYRYHLFDLIPLAREMVLDELEDAVLVLDRDRRILDFNRLAVETFPELHDAVGSSVDAVLPALRSSDATGETDSFPSSFRSYRQGEPRVYDVSATLLPSEETFHGYGLILRDVTDQRRRVRDLEQQTSQLERFASTLSHDIRNPLSVAQGQVELATEDRELASLEKASDAITRIDQIVDDLLTLSREGQTIDEREFVPLASLARAAWETTRTEDAVLELELDPDDGVYADETRLRNVFENLFRNALEFGGSDVTVWVGHNADGFYVEDDGPGIPTEHRDHVFEYEYTTATDGTGLGLAIVDSIARAHGWSVDATEGTHGGARFVFHDADVIRESSQLTTQPTTE